MAEAVAGIIVAEQIVATGVEAAAAVAVAAPTQPLKISLTQLSKPTVGKAPTSPLGRSHHTVTAIGDKAYIFGGLQADGQLCSTDVLSISLPKDKTTTKPSTTDTGYADYPAFPLQDSSTGYALVPSPRSGHAACARGKFVVIHGGCDAASKPIDEDNCIWLWDSEMLSWTRLSGQTAMGITMSPRHGHHIFVDEKQDFLVLHGGHTQGGGEGQAIETETWFYDFNAPGWTVIPRAPSASLAAAYADTTLYTISRDGDSSNLAGAVNFLRLRNSETERQQPDALVWQTVHFPANPLIPGPRPREGAALVPLDTGYGRHYLVYMFGCGSSSPNAEASEFYSDIWTLQLPTHGLTGAAVKDAIRDKLPGTESGEFTWAEANLQPVEQLELEGKVHPGPRGLFGASPCLSGKGVVLWGGVNAKGEKESDGWVLRLAYGYADTVREE